MNVRANALLVLIWLTVALLTYSRLAELTYELRQGWQPWEIEMVLTSGAVCIWAVSTLACLITLVVAGRPRR
jgi:hypothetical protein